MLIYLMRLRYGNVFSCIFLCIQNYQQINWKVIRSIERGQCDDSHKIEIVVWCKIKLIRTPLFFSKVIQCTTTDSTKSSDNFFFIVEGNQIFFQRIQYVLYIHCSMKFKKFHHQDFFYLYIYMHENLVMMLLAALKSHLFYLFFCKFTRYLI